MTTVTAFHTCGDNAYDEERVGVCDIRTERHTRSDAMQCTSFPVINNELVPYPKLLPRVDEEDMCVRVSVFAYVSVCTNLLS